MILQASLIGGWEKLELWAHTHLALLGLLVMVCTLEVIILKMTTSARLFTHPHHDDSDYDDSGEYEEDIYYEHLTTNYDQGARRPTYYHHRQQEPEQQVMHAQQAQYSYINYNETSSDENNHFPASNYQSTTTDVFRFVY